MTSLFRDPLLRSHMAFAVRRKPEIVKAVRDQQFGGASRNGNREPATRIVVAKKYICDRPAAEFARFPRLDQRGNMSGLPTHRERPAIDKHNNHGGAGRGDSLNELFLDTRKIQARHVRTLPVRGKSPFIAFVPSELLTNHNNG
jgi:hypothetical protein